jgi:hypothetical protein
MWKLFVWKKSIEKKLTLCKDYRTIGGAADVSKSEEILRTHPRKFWGHGNY